MYGYSNVRRVYFQDVSIYLSYPIILHPHQTDDNKNYNKIKLEGSQL